MAGGVAGKGSALVGVAIAKATQAVLLLQRENQNGTVTSGTPPQLASEVDPAVAEAITALQAIT
jgi:hypothetical protein